MSDAKRGSQKKSKQRWLASSAVIERQGGETGLRERSRKWIRRRHVKHYSDPVISEVRKRLSSDEWNQKELAKLLGVSQAEMSHFEERIPQMAIEKIIAFTFKLNINSNIGSFDIAGMPDDMMIEALSWAQEIREREGEPVLKGNLIAISEHIRSFAEQLPIADDMVNDSSVRDRFAEESETVAARIRSLQDKKDGSGSDTTADAVMNAAGDWLAIDVILKGMLLVLGYELLGEPSTAMADDVSSLDPEDELMNLYKVFNEELDRKKKVLDEHKAVFDRCDKESKKYYKLLAEQRRRLVELERDNSTRSRTLQKACKYTIATLEAKIRDLKRRALQMTMPRYDKKRKERWSRLHERAAELADKIGWHDYAERHRRAAARDEFSCG